LARPTSRAEVAVTKWKRGRKRRFYFGVPVRKRKGGEREKKRMPEGKEEACIKKEKKRKGESDQDKFVRRKKGKREKKGKKEGRDLPPGDRRRALYRPAQKGKKKEGERTGHCGGPCYGREEKRKKRAPTVRYGGKKRRSAARRVQKRRKEGKLQKNLERRKEGGRRHPVEPPNLQGERKKKKRSGKKAKKGKKGEKTLNPPTKRTDVDSVPHWNHKRKRERGKSWEI